MTLRDEPIDQEPKAHDIEEYEWGGDGSDLKKPVRAHVEAALVPTDQPYPPPLDQLLGLGDPRELDDLDARIAKLGFTQEHAPDLVRMVRDLALNTAMSDTNEVWAPAHALEALKGLDLSRFVADLIPMFDLEDDWFGEELPDVLGEVGAAALEPLRAYLHDRTRWIYGRARAASAIAKIAQQHSDLRGSAVQILSDELERSDQNDTETNGFLVADLMDIKAVEALPSIRRAFERDAVDESIVGDWGEVQKALGQTPDSHDPLLHRSRRRWGAKRAQLRSILPASLSQPSPGLPASPAPKKSAASKQKTKRKMSAAARKANKKKRK